MQTIPLNRLSQHELLLHTEPLEEEMPYDFRKPHRHDYFECFVFREGGGTHYIDFTAYPITASSVHFVFPGQVHLLRRRGARGRVIICRKELLASLPKELYSTILNRFYSLPCVYFNQELYSGIAAAETALRRELELGDGLSSGLVQCHLQLLLAACIRQGAEANADTAQNSRHLEQYHRLCELLDKSELDARLPVAHYAAQLGVSPKVLNEHIRQASGKTCAALLQDRLLTEAKRRLLYTSESCKEIAFTLGFRDTSYFNRFFRKHEGTTPLGFKQYWEEKYHHSS